MFCGQYDTCEVWLFWCMGSASASLQEAVLACHWLQYTHLFLCLLSCRGNGIGFVALTAPFPEVSIHLAT